MPSIAYESDPAKSETAESSTFKGFTVPVLTGLFCLCFLVGALRAASRNLLWMDEILAVWVARLPTYGDVWSALFRGSEASPPTYHLLLHFVRKIAGDSYVWFRLPSILASLISGLCTFSLLRRYLDPGAAAYGMAFSLLGLLASYGTEARPYALVTACFAGAVLLWDGLDSQRPNVRSICGISFLLALAGSLHFYAVLFVPCVAAMELVWSTLNRRIRIPVWLGLFVAGASSFAWLPLIRIQRGFIADETASADFYARPTLSKLLHSFSDLLISDKKQVLFLAATICIFATVLLLQHVRPASFRPATVIHLPTRRSENLYVIAGCAAAFPVLVFVFALMVTKTFNNRYCLITVLGFSFWLAYVLSSISALRATWSALLVVACPLALIASQPMEAGSASEVPDQVTLVKQATKAYPIVVAEGRLFFELEEATPPELKSRLVYVESPAGVISPDPTNEHHLDRWRSIRPDLKIVAAEDFFAKNPRFYLVHTGMSTDVMTSWLMKRNLLGRLAAMRGGALLFEAEAPR